MVTFNQRYVVDESGNRVAVLLDIADYHKLLEELEEDNMTNLAITLGRLGTYSTCR